MTNYNKEIIATLPIEISCQKKVLYVQVWKLDHHSEGRKYILEPLLAVRQMSEINNN